MSRIAYLSSLTLVAALLVAGCGRSVGLPGMTGDDARPPIPDTYTPPPDGLLPPDGYIPPGDTWPPDDGSIPPPPDMGPPPTDGPQPPPDMGPPPPDGTIPLPDTGPCSATCNQMCQVLLACGLYTGGGYGRCVNECAGWPASQTTCLEKLLCAGVSSCITYSTCLSSQKQPDLVVRDLQAKVSGTTVYYAVQVCNVGQGVAGGFYLDIYYDQNFAPKVKQSGDRYVVVPQLHPQQCTTQTFTRVSTPAGTYTSWAQVDSDASVAESNENNNVRGPIKVSVTSNPPVKKPDLQVSKMAATVGGSATAPSVTYTMAVCNNGSVASTASQVNLYFNRSSAPTGSETADRSRALGALSPGSCTTLSLAWANPKPGATYTSYAMVDPKDVVSESDEKNNVYGPLKVSLASAPGADLVISTFRYNAYAFNTVLYRLEVCNKGKGTAGQNELHVYYDLKSAPTFGQKGDQRVSVPILAAGACRTFYVTRRMTPSGSYSSYALVDVMKQVSETSETNNGAGPLAVSVGGSSNRPDLQVGAFKASVSGNDITYTAQVCNRGNVTATPFRVDFYLNLNNPPRPGQSGSPSAIIATLAANRCTTVSRTLSNAKPGGYVSWVQVDSGRWVAESNEQNNTGGPVKVTVTGSSTASCNMICRLAINCGWFTASQNQQCLAWCGSFSPSQTKCADTAVQNKSCGQLKQCNLPSPGSFSCTNLCSWFVNSCNLIPSGQYNMCLSTCGSLSTSQLQCVQKAYQGKQCMQALICVL